MRIMIINKNNKKKLIHPFVYKSNFKRSEYLKALNYYYYHSRTSYRRTARGISISRFTRLWWLVVLDRLHEGVDRVSQVVAMRDHLGGVEGQQLFVVRVHGCRCRGWHLNRCIVRLGYQQIVIATKLLGQGRPHLLPLLRHHLSRVKIHVIVILPCPAIVTATGRDDRRPLEEKRRVTLSNSFQLRIIYYENSQLIKII